MMYFIPSSQFSCFVNLYFLEMSFKEGLLLKGYLLGVVSVCLRATKFNIKEFGFTVVRVKYSKSTLK